MGNIDEKRLSALLERISKIKVELEALENEVSALCFETTPNEPAEATEAGGDAASDAVPVSETAEVTASTESQATLTDDDPIEIDIPDIGAQPILEDPVTGYAADPTSSETDGFNPGAEDLPDEEPAHQPAEADVQTEGQTMDDLPFGDDLHMETVEEPLFKADEAERPQQPRKALVDSTKAETAVMDVMADNQAWRTDRPGLQVKNIISAISLNDRVLLINVLFKEDPLLFQNTISAFNAMTTLDEAVSYIQINFPEWDLNSEPVYRLMMAVRRKLR